jgi:SAM-dependent methyltransferase
MKKIESRMGLACGHVLKFEPTGDTAFLPNEIGHQKTSEIIDAYNDLFLRVYAPFRPSRMLEIGIWHGGSLALWRDLFDGCDVVGVDAHDRIQESARKHFAEDPRISWHLLRCPNQKLAELGSFDLIIDDGMHGIEFVIPTFEILWPKLNPGGLFIIEDWKPDHCKPVELFTFLTQKIRGYWPADDAGPDAPFKMSVYRGLIAIEKKK